MSADGITISGKRTEGAHKEAEVSFKRCASVMNQDLQTANPVERSHLFTPEATRPALHFAESCVGFITTAILIELHGSLTTAAKSGSALVLRYPQLRPSRPAAKLY
jgi:hypothetical protein